MSADQARAKRQSIGVKYPAVDGIASRGVVTSQNDNKRLSSKAVQRDDKNSSAVGQHHHGHGYTSSLSSKSGNKQHSATSTCTTTTTRTMPLSVWKPNGGGGGTGRMPNYAAPTVSSQTRSVIHATSSHRDVPRRHQITSPVTSPRVHICPRFHVQPEIVTPPLRQILNRSRSVDTRTSTRSVQPSSSPAVGKSDLTISSELTAPSADSRQRSRSVESRGRRPVTGAAAATADQSEPSKAVVARPAPYVPQDVRDESSRTLRRTYSTGIATAASVGKPAKDARQNGNQRRAQSVTRHPSTSATASTKETARDATSTATRTRNANSHRTESSGRPSTKNETEVSEEYRAKLLEKRRLARQQQQQQQQQAVISHNTIDLQVKGECNESATDQSNSEATQCLIQKTNNEHEHAEPRIELDYEVHEQQQQQQLDSNKNQQQQQPNESNDVETDSAQSSTERQAATNAEQNDTHVEEKQRQADEEEKQQEQQRIEKIKQEQERLEKIRQEQEQERMEKAARDEEERLERKKHGFNEQKMSNFGEKRDGPVPQLATPRSLLKLALIMQRVKSVEGSTSPKSPNDDTMPAENQLKVFQQPSTAPNGDVKVVVHSSLADDMF